MWVSAHIHQHGDHADAAWREKLARKAPSSPSPRARPPTLPRAAPVPAGGSATTPECSHDRAFRDATVRRPSRPARPWASRRRIADPARSVPADGLPRALGRADAEDAAGPLVVLHRGSR